jgi:hypothetical protein
MNDDIPDPKTDLEARRHRRCEKLGTFSPRCAACGESDPLVLEQDHTAGKAYDPLTCILCRNCHRKRSNAALNAKAPSSPPHMVRAAHLMQGLADFLQLLIIALLRYADLLLQAAADCPAPWGHGKEKETDL